MASTDCTDPDCETAPALFNASLSLNAETEMEFKYQMGEVSGGVYWEQVQLGGFGIGYQAFGGLTEPLLSLELTCSGRR